MAQVTLYMDDETAEQMRASAKAAGLSRSAWLTQLVRERTRTSWPDQVVALAGTWSDDFPSAEDLRSTTVSDVPRETL